MRLYREFSTWNAAGTRTAVNPTAVSAATSTIGGTAIEALTPVNDGATGRYRVTTIDALYASGTVYRIAWTCTIAGFTFTRTVRYMHCTASATAIPGAPTVGVVSVTDTTATFSNVLGTDATSTLITLVPVGGGSAITAIGSGAFITATGLSPQMTYFYAAQGVNGAALSAITAGDIGTFTTLPGGIPDNPIIVKFWFRNRATLSTAAPRYVNADRVGHTIIGTPTAPLGQGENMRLRLEIHHPIWPRINSVTVRGQVKQGSSGGMLDGTRDNDGS